MPLQPEPQSDYVEKFKVAILDNSALTENLTDDEAKIYLDWALTVAEKVANTVADETDAEEKRENLMKLLRVMSRLVTYRQEKDNDWFLNMLDTLSNLQLSLINIDLAEEHRQMLTNLYDADNATLLQYLTKLLLGPSPDESSTPPGNIEAYQPPDTDVKSYEAPKRDIESYTPPQRNIQPRPSKPENGHSDY